MNTAEERNAIIQKIVAFVNDAGIACIPGAVPANSFLPGIEIVNGTLIYDAESLLYPGDLLHEAGHLAVLAPVHRNLANGSVNLSGDLHEAAAEMGAIAWSWAANEHLGLDPALLFHAGGYKGGSDSMIQNFVEGRFIGVPLLQYLGLTKVKDDGGGAVVFPKMESWVRQ